MENFSAQAEKVETFSAKDEKVENFSAQAEKVSKKKKKPKKANKSPSATGPKEDKACSVKSSCSSSDRESVDDGDTVVVESEGIFTLVLIQF